MVALSALLVALFAAALAVWAHYSLNSLRKRVLSLSSPDLSRFSPPVEDIKSVFLPEIESEMDVVGAWALEEERAGRPVSLETMQMQRRMWLEN